MSAEWAAVICTAMVCFTAFVICLAWLGEKTHQRGHESALLVSQQRHERGVLN